MFRPLFAATLALVLTAPLAAQAQDPVTPIPVDTSVTIGTLPNGLRYYIRTNAKPEKRAELRLVVNAGSILEDPDQLGLAHFLEHTAFNGTTNFKKNELVSYLESIGVRFGADLNAYTSFDETVYILPIPTDTARLVETAFQILEDWAHGQLFDATEVANERGVVVEEWRGRKGAADRMLQKWLPIALKDSRYATRLPVGTQESILAATPEKLRRFYNDWYRPDLMAVIAVGDFDKSVIEALIVKHFSRIEPRSTPRVRITPDVPANRAPLVAITTDREETNTSVSVSFKVPSRPTKTVGDYRNSLAEALYLSILNNRFAEIGQRPDAPFLAAGASKGGFFARSMDAFTLGANVREDGILPGIEALLNEARRIDQFGVLQSELDRAKSAILRNYERAFTERDKTQSAQLVEEYVGNFLVEETIPGIAYEYSLAQSLLPAITLDEVNALGRGWITDENRVILVQAPDKPGVVKVPTEPEVLAAIDRSAAVALTAWTESLSEDPLIAQLPPKGGIVAERMIAGTGVTEWKLSNGARVLIKPTDFKADEIAFTAYSPGGTSLVSDADFITAQLAADVLGQFGVAAFNDVDLRKKLTGKAASASASIGESSEGLSGGASPKDLETLLQLVHLRFTAPRIDTLVFEALRNQLAPMLANRGADPATVFNDTVTVTMGSYHHRARPLTAATFAEFDLDRALQIYRDRFADAGDFTFVFVGNVDPAALRPLAEQYLASLPTAGRVELAKDVTLPPPRGVVKKTVRKGTEPKATTVLVFSGPVEYTPQNRFALRALTDLLQIKATETLREQLGGTYSPNVGGGASREPREGYSVVVSYESAPENVEKLTTGVFQLFASLKATGPTAADVEKVREQLVRQREVELKTNAYWLTNISARDRAGEDIAGFLDAYDAMIRGLTSAMVQEAARRYLDTANYMQFVLLPELPLN